MIFAGKKQLISANGSIKWQKLPWLYLIIILLVLIGVSFLCFLVVCGAKNGFVGTKKKTIGANCSWILD